MRIGIVLFLLCHAFAPGGSAQLTAPSGPDVKLNLELRMQATPDPHLFTIALHNRGTQGVGLVLGYVLGNGNKHLVIHYTLTDSTGAKIGFEDRGEPIAGTVGVFLVDLHPDETFTYKLDLRQTTLATDPVMGGRVCLRGSMTCRQSTMAKPP